MIKNVSGFMGLALLLTVATGCDNKIGQCNALIEQINASHSVIEEGTDLMMHPEKIAEGLKTFNEHIETEAGKIGAVELSDEKLAGYSKEYISMMRDVSKSITEMAGAAGELTGLQKEVETGTKSWMGSVSKLRVDCIKKRKECEELGKALQKTPMVTGLKPDEDAKKLKEYSDAISAAKVEDEDLVKARDEVVKQIGTFAEAMGKVAGVMKTVESATADIQKAAEKESPIVDGINGYCGGG